jgi:catechol 2,3-dioxygenase-like lactoylglutathione lyase family enzyme
MIDHVIVNVSEFQRSKAFYEAALAPLGYTLTTEWESGAGFATRDGAPELWIRGGERPSGPVHVAIRSPNRSRVDAFYEAAMAAGAADNGPPGPRPHYHENYYAAFVYDPDGNNLEAVCHNPE